MASNFSYVSIMKKSLSPLTCRVYVILLALCISLPAWAQYPVKGRVIDIETSLPVPGALITLKNADERLVADEDGYFTIQRRTILRINFIVTHVGYRAKEVTFAGRDTLIEVGLEPSQNVLTEVVVQGYETDRKILETAGAISLLTKEDLHRFSNTTLVPAMNTVPGVRMEERSPGSYRLSIRGSLLRSPFGVRNIKVYWNDIPFTDPGGNTQINLLDFNTIGRVEVIKGPASSIYGAGTGGVVLLRGQRAPFGENGVEAQAIVGSYGLQNYTLTAQSGNQDNNTTLTYGHMQYGGYREHSAMERQMLNLRSELRTSRKSTLSIAGFYSNLSYQIPGGIDSTTFAQNPRAARPAALNARGDTITRSSAAQNSSINLRTFNLGLSQRYDFNERLTNVTSLYGTFSEFDHPFITDYKRNAEQGLGVRTRTTYKFNVADLPAKFTAGGEYQRGFIVARNYGNNFGTPTSLILDDELTNRQYFLFSQAEIDLPYQFIVTAGLSYNRLNYRLNRISDAAQRPDFGVRREFTPVFSPRVAVLKKFGDFVAVHGSISYGFSPPTTPEIRTSEGTVNVGLEAEQGINYEAGVRGNAWTEDFAYDIVVFSLQLDQTIVSRVNEQGVVLFSNAGNTSQNGIEATGSYYINNDPTLWLSLFKVWGSYTYNHFRFGYYAQQTISGGQVVLNEFDGNRLTGVPPHVVVAGIDAATRFGLYTNLTINFTDRIPLNDANTVYANAYTLLGGRIGYRTSYRKFRGEIFAGVDNLLNQTYSLGNDLNAFGGRFYQPAAPINFFSGLQVRYIIN
jgi:iron complex outermembrane recepter protein